jgi:hypothetical protein
MKIGIGIASSQLFAKEIDVADIGFDDKIMARLRKAGPKLAKCIGHFDFRG